MQLLLRMSVGNDAENGHSNMWLSSVSLQASLTLINPKPALARYYQVCSRKSTWTKYFPISSEQTHGDLSDWSPNAGAFNRFIAHQS